MNTIRPKISSAGNSSRKNNKSKFKRKGKRQRKRSKKYSAKISEDMNTHPPVITNSSWFWRNYRNALEWQGRHEMAYWRSRSFAFEYANSVLHQYIEELHSNRSRPINVAGNNGILCEDHSIFSYSCSGKKSNKQVQDNKTYQDEPEQVNTEVAENSAFEFEINDDMLEFLETSMKHKLELKKFRESHSKESAIHVTDNSSGTEDSDSDTLPPKKQVGLQRIEEMHCLYGKAAPMIMGMETALQLAFDRNCDKTQPPMWPIIPLKM